MGSDLKNSVTRLRQLLKTMRYPNIPSKILSLETKGPSVKELLQVLHFALLDYSQFIAQLLLDNGCDLHGKTDLRFLENTFRIVRDVFKYFPSINPTQFLSQQFAVRKVDLVSDILQLIRQNHIILARKKRQENAKWSQPADLMVKSVETHVENHVLPSETIKIGMKTKRDNHKAISDISHSSILHQLTKDANEKNGLGNAMSRPSPIVTPYQKQEQWNSPNTDAREKVSTAIGDYNIDNHIRHSPYKINEGTDYPFDKKLIHSSNECKFDERNYDRDEETKDGITDNTLTKIYQKMENLTQFVQRIDKRLQNLENRMDILTEVHESTHQKFKPTVSTPRQQRSRPYSPDAYASIPNTPSSSLHNTRATSSSNFDISPCIDASTSWPTKPTSLQQN